MIAHDAGSGTAVGAIAVSKIRTALTSPWKYSA